VQGGQQTDDIQRESVDVVMFALVGLAAVITWLGIVPRVHAIDLVAVIAVLGGGYPVLREALENLVARRMTMELSMSIALAAALAIREFSTALFILFFVLGTKILEDLTVHRGRAAMQNLLSLLPKKALVRRSAKVQELAIAELRLGDVVLIRPAAEIPVDGVVVVGIPRSTNPRLRGNPGGLIESWGLQFLPAP
jgi:cation transport ATPase